MNSDDRSTEASKRPSEMTSEPHLRNGMKFFWWLRRLIYLWVKSKSLPKKAIDFQWDTKKPVCYVLNSHSITDLLVLDYHCRKLKLPKPHKDLHELSNPGEGSYIYLAKSGLVQKKKAKHIPTGLFHLLEKVRADQKDIQLIPVSVFWGRDAGKEEKSLIKLLFFDDEQGGWLQRFILFFVQGRNVYCSFGKPISTLNFIEQEKDTVSGTKKLRRVLRVHFHRQREAMVGPYLYDREQMMRSILHSKAIRDFFDQEVEKKGKSREKLEEQARRYLDEIAASLSPHVVRFADSILSWIFHKIYRGIDIRNGNYLRALAETHEIIYLPCHRSHMDYLLLGYSLYHLGVPTPHTAAGVNLNFWPIGALFRRGGAFFIRRSFGGNKLYSAIFTEYVNFLITGGYSMCFYIEGGRSRTGRLLQPKLGMISMVVKTAQEHKEKPIALIPTYISYDKLMEARSYFHELRGKTKKAESVWQLFRIPKLLAYEFGKAYINFSEPIDLNTYLANTSQEGKPNTVVDLSKEVMTKINQAIHLSPISLFSLALLALPKHAIAEDKLTSMVNIWLELLRAVPYDKGVVLPEASARDLLKLSETLSQVQRFEHITGDVIFVNEKDCVFLNYYRNNALPLMIIPSLIANLFSYCNSVDFDGLIKILSESYKLLKNDFFLKWKNEEIAPVIKAYVYAMCDLKLLCVEGDFIRPAESHTEESFCLTAMGRIIGNVVERYCLYIYLLSQNSYEVALDFEAFGKSCEALAKKSSILGGYHELEYFDKNEYKQFMDTMFDLEYLKKSGSQFLILSKAKACIDNLAPLSSAITKTLNGFGKENYEGPKVFPH